MEVKKGRKLECGGLLNAVTLSSMKMVHCITVVVVVGV